MPDEFVSWCSELLAPTGLVRFKRMFGGHGFYVDEVFIAILTGERLYLKVDETTRGAFVHAGCEPFSFTARGERVVLGYFSAPAEAMDSPAQMRPWARLAMASALRARASKPPAKPRAAKAATRKPAPRKPTTPTAR
jgi:DNA transformation protein